MNYWLEELNLVEAAALRIQALEQAAGQRFEQALARAAQEGAKDRAPHATELSAWLAARHDTEAAWTRWAAVMKARPPA
ncbi:MAG: hypothetical protein ACXWC6_00415 [Ramlibacter sp.]